MFWHVKKKKKQVTAKPNWVNRQRLFIRKCKQWLNNIITLTWDPFQTWRYRAIKASGQW